MQDFEVLGKAIDEYAKALNPEDASKLRKVAYTVLQAAHSYIFMELDAYGSTEIEDPKAMEALEVCINNGTASQTLPKLFFLSDS